MKILNFNLKRKKEIEIPLEEKSVFNIGVIGFGIVGSSTAIGLKEVGHNIFINDIKSLEEFRDNFHILQPYDLSKTDITMICLPTPTVPLVPGGKIDTSIIDAISEQLGEMLKKQDKYHVFVMRSTVSPGITRRFGKILEEISKKKLGEHFGLVMNPEFLRAFNYEDDFRNPRLIVLGEFDKKSGDIIESVYAPFNREIIRIGLEEAELTKYWNNIYNSIKISAHNELWKISKELGIDFEQVRKTVTQSAEAYWNPEYGTHGGLPYGGTCLPKDTIALQSYLYEREINSYILDATIRVNESMKEEKNNEIHPYFEERMHSSYENLRTKEDVSKNEVESLGQPVLLGEGIRKDENVEKDLNLL